MPVVALGVALLLAAAGQASPVFFPKVSEECATCDECHTQQTPAISQQWGDPKHCVGNIGCRDCHGAEPGAAGAHTHNGDTIHTLVRPEERAARARQRQDFKTRHLTEPPARP